MLYWYFVLVNCIGMLYRLTVLDWFFILVFFILLLTGLFSLFIKHIIVCIMNLIV